VAGLLAALLGALGGLAIEGQIAGSASRDQVTAQAIAELGLNIGTRILNDTANHALVANLETVQDSRAQGWVTNSGSPCTWSGVTSQLSDMLLHFAPLTPGPVPNQVQASSPPASAGYVRVWRTVLGPGNQAYTWEAVVGIATAAAPCPSWQDTGTARLMTFPINTFGFAWVWGPEGQLLGELTLYPPPQTPGFMLLTYPDCPSYFSAPACHLPTSVQVALPAGTLLWNDPNVNAPAMP